MQDTDKVFHLGLCMAGSISAGAYTAGVVDYLIEALEGWENHRHDASLPSHQVVIDVICGASGGGITSAMALFTMQDKLEHAKLESDGITYTPPKNNILWDSWVELNDEDVFNSILATADIRSGYVPSAINSTFIDQVASKFEKYIGKLQQQEIIVPPYLSKAAELVLTLFNATGISYRLYTKTSAGSNATSQFVFEHRDIAHFRLAHEYMNDGRIPIATSQTKYLKTLIESSLATGAFPIGLKARKVSREAKFIWDNDFFHRGRFTRNTIGLGKKEMQADELYTSLNADGGVANNEPVELARTIMRAMRSSHYGDMNLERALFAMTDEDKEDRLKELTNTSVLLIDPFPSTNSRIKLPGENSEHLLSYGPDLVLAMRSQLLFDAKEALEGYEKANYGLHVIAPSKEGIEPPKALACASVGGFGGFINREFRVHDYYLGRHNCQSFLRKYFVVDPYEEDPENRKCVQAVIDGYSDPAAFARYAFKDENGKTWLPVIPDVNLSEPIKYVMVDGKGTYAQEKVLPVYKLEPLEADYMKLYTKRISSRVASIAINIFKLNFFMKFLVKISTLFFRNRVSSSVQRQIETDLKKRRLMK